MCLLRKQSKIYQQITQKFHYTSTICNGCTYILCNHAKSSLFTWFHWSSDVAKMKKNKMRCWIITVHINIYIHLFFFFFYVNRFFSLYDFLCWIGPDLLPSPDLADSTDRSGSEHWETERRPLEFKNSLFALTLYTKTVYTLRGAGKGERNDRSRENQAICKRAR